MISNSLGTYVIEPGQTITFDGRASYDLDGVVFSIIDGMKTEAVHTVRTRRRL